MAGIAQSDTVRHRPRKVRDFVLLHSALFQALTRGEIKVGGEIIVGNEMSVIAAAAGEQLVAETRVLVDLQHVHADMRHAGGKGFA